ncbi:hypothetical protein Hanom_Chr08g00741851 [Helianthus anomalus]
MPLSPRRTSFFRLLPPSRRVLRRLKVPWTNRLASLQGDKNWLISQGLVGAFKYLRRSEPFVALLDHLSTTAYKSGQHDGVYEGYVSCHQMNKVTPEFQEPGGGGGVS